MLFSALAFSILAAGSFSNTADLITGQAGEYAIGQPGQMEARQVVWPNGAPGYQPLPAPQPVNHQIYRSDGSSSLVMGNGMGGYTSYNSDGSSSMYMANPGGRGGVVYNSDGSSALVN